MLIFMINHISHLIGCRTTTTGGEHVDPETVPIGVTGPKIIFRTDINCRWHTVISAGKNIIKVQHPIMYTVTVVISITFTGNGIQIIEMYIKGISRCNHRDNPGIGDIPGINVNK